MPDINPDFERYKCAESPLYFIDSYCKIFVPTQGDDTTGKWVPFHPWKDQAKAVRTIRKKNRIVILKARQLGFTWIVIAYALWLMLFRGAAVILIFSRRDEEAIKALNRLKGMYANLPDFFRFPASKVGDSKHEWELPNGSQAMSFPTTGGRSYTGTLVIIDEADDENVNLDALLSNVEPTVDGGGKLVMLSTSDKTRPLSRFKTTYMAAKKGQNSWTHIFSPWMARPERTQAWYDEKKRDILAGTQSLDMLHQEFPATDTEALAASSKDKRLPGAWLEQCFVEMNPLTEVQIKKWFSEQLPMDYGPPSIPDLRIYVPPVRGRRYAIGADPAEGNTTSDDSSFHVADVETGEEVAACKGKIEPATFAEYINKTAMFYNGANVMVERNNHGHTVILWLREHGRVRLLEGHDSNPGAAITKTGWMSSTKGKVILYDTCADAFRHEETILHSFSTWVQLASIEGNTLRAPEGMHDDEADSYALTMVAVAKSTGEWTVSAQDRSESAMARSPEGVYHRDVGDSISSQIENMGW